MERSNGCDVAIVGGGLAGGLIALALAERCPGLHVRVIEGGAAAGGHHRWSWFASDLDPAGTRLMAPFRMAQWHEGYEVAFPRHCRTLQTPYRSLASRDFAAHLATALPAGTLATGQRVAGLAADGVTLAEGGRVPAGVVIDCRGFQPTARLQGGWQVFLGRHLRTDRPHGLTRPTIMDATVDQTDGYRFVYVLPLAADEVFIEDTYYQDAPVLDRPLLSGRLDAYAAAHGWAGTVLEQETGVLPVITGGDFAGWQAEQRVPGVARAGAGAGFVHPLTSYTLPFAVETALAVADAFAHQPQMTGDALATMLEQRAADHWRRTGFYRLLGSMLFGAAGPAERYRVFERFYTLSDPLIERFYAGRSTWTDRLRVLSGRPPVPIGAAVQALVQPRAPLYSGTQQQRDCA
ncbi:lycopene beta-cyclase CrtY [Croceibacterium sp. TMG7-5b_MA50]|uniref:lycopene beta-cyclase CrtY n=1 Tax=Croceibacterium sp. TMG7-5b_MA50 TaxID=3121290 RepID=UPI0032217725